MIKQAAALSWINLMSMPRRLASSLISILSIACVTAVILSVLALTQGMVKTMERSGLDDTLIVMRAGASSELESVIFPAEANLMANHEQIARQAQGLPLVSSEMFVNAKYKKAPDDRGESLGLRGVSKDTYLFRPNFELVAGQAFQSGLRQVIIGRAIARRLPELVVGETMTLGDSEWLIAGIFADKNSVFESEIWADLGLIQSDYQRGDTMQSVRLALKPGTDIAALNQEWQRDPRLNVRIVLEKTFFAAQAEDMTRLIRWIGFPVAVLMALGALIAALNTMFSTVANRSREIATHKAIGFSPLAIFSSVLTEAAVLALAGGLIGVLPLYLLFDGWTASTQSTANLSQLMFNFEISWQMMGQAMLLSIGIGLLGGIFPALKSMRLPVSLALRQV